MPTMRVARITVGLLAALCSLIVGADMPAVSANDSGTSASTDTVSIGGAEIYVGFESGELGLPRGALLNWVRKSACAVTRILRALSSSEGQLEDRTDRRR